MIGNYHNQLNSPDSAILFYQKALMNFQLLRKKEAVPDIMTNLADMYTIKGNYAQSVYYFRKALILSDSLNLTKKMGFPIYFGLGRVYMELRDFELSDSYFRLAEKYYGNRALREKFVFCNNRGNFYYYKEEFPQALYWCQKAMSLLKGGNFPFFLALDEINLADIYLNMGKLDSSQHYLKRGEAYFSNQQNQTAQYYINTIKIGLALKQNKLSQVHELLKKEVPPVVIDLNMVTIRNKYLEDYYAKMGDFRMAYHYQARNRILNDSIRADRTFKRTAELDMRYKLNKTVLKKDQLINNQVAQLEDLRLTQFIWILVCVLVLTVAFFTYIFMKRQRDLQRLKHMDQVTKLRMRNIRNQISPHFVLNVLNREIVSVEESRRNGLYGLAKLLRESLEMTGQASVSLAKELEFVETYIELERGALGPEFRLNWEVDSQIAVSYTHLTLPTN
jgi:tetratricopeptide (TPR) repeat protein